mmetsp:Transcript_36335/g.82325  ORF Transcript_36335/g.82325 Transcript_36335/m.82325 type:complete len:937 (-) Transcript_36335:4-2814(-)
MSLGVNAADIDVGAMRLDPGVQLGAAAQRAQMQEAFLASHGTVKKQMEKCQEDEISEVLLDAGSEDHAARCAQLEIEAFLLRERLSQLEGADIDCRVVTGLGKDGRWGNTSSSRPGRGRVQKLQMEVDGIRAQLRAAERHKDGSPSGMALQATSVFVTSLDIKEGTVEKLMDSPRQDASSRNHDSSWRRVPGPAASGSRAAASTPIASRRWDAKRRETATPKQPQSARASPAPRSAAAVAAAQTTQNRHRSTSASGRDRLAKAVDFRADRRSRTKEETPRTNPSLKARPSPREGTRPADELSKAPLERSKILLPGFASNRTQEVSEAWLLSSKLETTVSEAAALVKRLEDLQQAQRANIANTPEAKLSQPHEVDASTVNEAATLVKRLGDLQEAQKSLEPKSVGPGDIDTNSISGKCAAEEPTSDESQRAQLVEDASPVTSPSDSKKRLSQDLEAAVTSDFENSHQDLSTCASLPQSESPDAPLIDSVEGIIALEQCAPEDDKPKEQDSSASAAQEATAESQEAAESQEVAESQPRPVEREQSLKLWQQRWAEHGMDDTDAIAGTSGVESSQVDDEGSVEEAVPDDRPLTTLGVSGDKTHLDRCDEDLEDILEESVASFPDVSASEKLEHVDALPAVSADSTADDGKEMSHNTSAGSPIAVTSFDQQEFEESMRDMFRNGSLSMSESCPCGEGLTFGKCHYVSLGLGVAQQEVAESGQVPIVSAPCGSPSASPKVLGSPIASPPRHVGAAPFTEQQTFFPAKSLSTGHQVWTTASGSTIAAQATPTVTRHMWTAPTPTGAPPQARVGSGVTVGHCSSGSLPTQPLRPEGLHTASASSTGLKAVRVIAMAGPPAGGVHSQPVQATRAPTSVLGATPHVARAGVVRSLQTAQPDGVRTVVGSVGQEHRSRSFVHTFPSGTPPIGQKVQARTIFAAPPA